MSGGYPITNVKQMSSPLKLSLALMDPVNGPEGEGPLLLSWDDFRNVQNEIDASYYYETMLDHMDDIKEDEERDYYEQRMSKQRENKKDKYVRDVGTAIELSLISLGHLYERNNTKQIARYVYEIIKQSEDDDPRETEYGRM